MIFCFIFIYVILLVINSFDGQIMVDWNSDPRLDSIRHYLNQRLQSEHHKWHSLNKNNHRLPNIIHSSAKNRSKSNGALFYNRIPKCGSSTVSVTNYENSTENFLTKLSLNEIYFQFAIALTIIGNTVRL